MAITASTAGVNRVVRGGGQAKTLIDDIRNFVSSTTSWNQGDLLSLDTTNHVIKVVAATGDAANFLGIADNSVKNGHLVGPYDGLTPVDAAQSGPYAIGPIYDCVASLKLKASDAFNPGDKVYLADGQDSQTVSVTNPGDGNFIGIFVDAAVASATAGQTAQIKIGERYLAFGF